MSYAERATKFLAERRERLVLRDVLAATVPIVPTRSDPGSARVAPTVPSSGAPRPDPPEPTKDPVADQNVPQHEKNEGNEESPLGTRFPVACELLTTPEEVTAALPALLAAETLGFDLETAGAADRAEALDPRLGRIRLMQFAAGERVSLVDCDRVAPSTLAPLFADGPVLVGHHVMFDLQFLQAAGLPIPAAGRLFDTMLASQLLHAGAEARHSLAAVVERELGRPLDKTAQASDWSGALSAEQLAYAAADAAVLPPLAERLRVRLARDGLTRAMELEMRALPAVAWMEFAGASRRRSTARWLSTRPASWPLPCTAPANTGAFPPPVGEDLSLASAPSRAHPERERPLPNRSLKRSPIHERVFTRLAIPLHRSTNWSSSAYQARKFTMACHSRSLLTVEGLR